VDDGGYAVGLGLLNGSLQRTPVAGPRIVATNTITGDVIIGVVTDVHHVGVSLREGLNWARGRKHQENGEKQQGQRTIHGSSLL
jgi:hypothetical protein